jgi:hypothetical protein
MARYAKFFSVGAGGGGTNNLQLPVGTILDTTLRQVQDGTGTGSPLYLSTRRVGITSDSSVTTQTSSVIQATTTNANLVIAPNGTGGLIASVPDGTATGGNARGAYSVDLQTSRSTAANVASGNFSTIIGGGGCTASGQYSVAGGLGSSSSNYGGVTFGNSNTNNSYGGVVSGGQNNTGGNADYVTISGGRFNNTTGSTNGVIAGGISNTASSNFSVVSGGQSNAASTATHATVVGGQSNTSSGNGSISGGFTNTASGQYSVALGNNNIASGNGCVSLGSSNTSQFGTSVSIGSSNVGSNNRTYAFGTSNNISAGDSVGLGNANTLSGGNNLYAFGSGNVMSGIQSYAIGYQNSVGTNNGMSLGFSGNVSAPYATSMGLWSRAYLYGQVSMANGLLGGAQNAQQSLLTAYKLDALASNATTILSLDGTGVTNLIIPFGSNRLWAVKVVATAFVSVAGGTLVLGDSYMGEFTLLFKRVGGTSSVVGVNAGNIIYDTNMATAAFTFAAGASQDLQITFKAPTTASATTFRCVAKVELVEVAY